MAKKPGKKKMPTAAPGEPAGQQISPQFLWHLPLQIFSKAMQKQILHKRATYLAAHQKELRFTDG